jgi:5-carboxymethyl-2-hydroxymuconate isomerase
MPHILVEYSANLDGHIDITGLVVAIHEAALATGVFPLGGTRTRAARHDIYAIADQHPDNAFIHVQLSIAEGRDTATRHRAGETIFAALTSATEKVCNRHPLALSLSISEIDSATSFKKNNIHDYVAARREDAE